MGAWGAPVFPPSRRFASGFPPPGGRGIGHIMKHSLKAYARALRGNMTDAEQKLWFRLRQRQLGGVRFRRQVPLGPYIADFLSYEAKVVIEVDGGQH